MCSTGLRQPVTPTPASRKDADMILTKFRRETGSLHSPAAEGNSRSTQLLNSGVSASWSKLRQYFGPMSGSGQGGGIVFIGGRQSNFAKTRLSSRERTSRPQLFAFRQLRLDPHSTSNSS